MHTPHKFIPHHSPNMSFNPLPHFLRCNKPWKEVLENNVGKREKAGNHHSLLFLHCFLVCQGQILQFEQSSINRLQKLSFWTRLICCLVVSMMLTGNGSEKKCGKRRRTTIFTFSNELKCIKWDIMNVM